MDTNDHTTERTRAHAMGAFFKALKDEGSLAFSVRRDQPERRLALAG